MSNSSALASLTATYTDSEGENDNEPDSPSEQNAASQSPDTPSDKKSNNSSSSRPGSPAVVRVTAKVTTLVSYHDDTVASDDDDDTEDIPHEVIMIPMEESAADEPRLFDDENNEYIPPEPAGQCAPELQDKITKLFDKMQTQKMDMNAVIHKRKDFRNPSIYEKLIQFCQLNELGTNYPPALYDPLKWSAESYYEELAKVQKVEMDKREKERKSKVEFVSGTKKYDDDKKRKSKWDQPGGGGVASQSIKPAGLVQPSLTSSATGTKGTVISAFGSLPKKPRP